MKKMSATFASATLALTLAMGGTALYAQDTDGPDTAVPADPAPEPMPTEAAPPPPADPAPAPVDEDGDGVDDITGEPIPDGAPQR
ncbi:hypothetical protein [Aurantiacibacter flavus]|uniref:Uncharacterized protein n=1 Tax=Aurantiacibacter flavus TaxID=3145232 RepID=A0ABV0D103_9SPHN